MATRQPIIIAHRGASGYLPEHTLAAKALAHAMGADFIEQDVVLTADAVPIVLHDISLDSTTDVAHRFPHRARDDGHYYAMDFTLDEIRSLSVHERATQDDNGRRQAVYPGRFPVDLALFQIPTLAEEISFIAGLDKSRGRSTGLYIELKSPNRHRAAGLDISRAVCRVLQETGYAQRPGQVFLQCFDDQTLQQLRGMLDTPLPLIQLIADNSWGEDSAVDYDYLRSPEGLDDIARYADGIGPWVAHLYRGKDAAGKAQLTGLVQAAQARGLLVHPYTLRQDDLPKGIGSFTELLDLLLRDLRVDGVFTDFPDLVAGYLDGPGQRA
ncbi:MAG: glycerophosphodiester phosphodiesterase [Halioglobus sp.]|nr:glycerophosphodiester phosphodiesterase [Halioglobus sp.]